MKKILIFSLGALTGSMATWFIVKNKYKNIADEEIASVIECFKNKDKKQKDENLEVKEAETIISTNEYFDVSENVDEIKPYIIEAVEFGELPGYEEKTYIYCADNTVIDDDDCIVDDPDILFNNILDNFNSNDNEEIYIRNDKLKIDYEILKSNKTIDDIVSNKEVNN